MSSKAQRVMLGGLWNRARAILHPDRVKWTKIDSDQCRHEFTTQSIGRAITSWTQLNTRGDVDMLKGRLLAIIQPNNLDAQLRQVRQENKRALWVVRELMRELGKDDNFVMGVIEQIENGIDPNTPDDAWQRDRERGGRRRRLEELTVPELKKVMSALRSVAGRAKKKPGREYVLH